jgi:hypothetical protein
MAKKKTETGSMKQVAEHYGIPMQHLKIVKILFPDGFKTNSSADVKRVTEYYEANKDFVEEVASESLDELKKIEKAIKIQTDELKLLEKKQQYITIKDEKEFLSALVASIQGILLAKLVDELHSKIETTPSDKRATIGSEMYNEIVAAMKELVEKRGR